MASSRRKKPIFDSESDEDSVATDTTAQSEEQATYNVERVLSEEWDSDEDRMTYLIKWEGYPLHRATWEPEENLQDSVIMEEWEKAKSRIKAGLEVPFDTEEYNAAYEYHEQQKEERAKRREAKKRRRRRQNLLPSSAESSDVPLAVKSSAKKKKSQNGQPVAPKKGVAQKIEHKKKRGHATLPSDSESESFDDDGEDGDSESEADSLFEELGGRDESPRAAKSPPASSTGVRKSPRKAIAQASVLKETARVPPARPIFPTHARKSAPGPGPAAPGPSMTAKSTAAATARRTGKSSVKQVGSNVFANPDWGAQKKGRQRPRVTGETPKDSFDPKFRNLSQQNRFQKYSKNEKAPSFEALKGLIVDPKTGKTISRDSEEPVPTGQSAAPQKRTSVSEISAVANRRPDPLENTRNDAQVPPTAQAREPYTHAPQGAASGIADAYRRRSPPPPARENAPLKPDSSKSESQRPAPTSGAMQSASGAIHGAYHRRTPPPANDRRRSASPARSPKHTAATEDITAALKQPRRSMTCQFWQRNECVYSAETCRNAHWIVGDGPNRPPKELTCFFWHLGRCNKVEEACDYAHHNTGIIADPPPGYAHPPPQRAVSPTGPSAAVPAPRAEQPLDLRAIPKHKVTCYYWQQPAGCSKPDRVCKFAHWDTGVHAGPPGTFQWRTSAALAAGEANADRAANGARPRDLQAAAASPLTRLQNPSETSHSAVQGQGLNLLNNQNHSPIPLRDSPAQSPVAPATESHAQMPPQPHNKGPTHKRPSIVPCSTVHGVLEVRFSDKDEALNLAAKFEVPDTEAFQRLAGDSPVVQVNHFVMSGDFENILWSQTAREVTASTGGIAADQSLGDELQTLSEMCKLNAGGFLASIAGLDSKMLIYPSNSETWRFIETEDVQLPPGCLLHFRLLSHLPGVSEPVQDSEPVQTTPVITHEQQAIAIGENIVQLDRDRMLVPKPGRPPATEVLLLIPPSYHDELTLYCRYFKAQGLHVYHSGMPGAWARFRDKCRLDQVYRLLILHPQLRLWQVPGLASLLDSHGRVGIFSIGVDYITAANEGRQPQFACHRMFPQGKVVFITDDVFVRHPEKATQVIGAFLEKQDVRPAAARESNRIAARPGLKDWIFNLALEKTSVRGRRDNRDTRDNRWWELYKMVARLCPQDDEDPWDLSQPLPHSSLVSISPALLPTFEKLWDTNPTAATDFMVNWFAGWAIFNAHQFRRFEICHVPDLAGDVMLDPEAIADPRGWSKKYQHLEVSLPETVVKRQQQKK